MGDYLIIGAVEEGLLYASGNKIMRYNINSEKSEEILDGAGNGSLSADGKSLIYRIGNDYAVKNNRAKRGADKIELTNLTMKIEPRKEWNRSTPMHSAFSETIST